jgi:6-phosphogluconolactonase
MEKEILVFVGTYTEPIRFGTGKILQGKGKGIYIFRFDLSSGAMEPVNVVQGITNPSYLTFDPAHRFLYAVNELKVYEDKPTGTVSAFAIDSKTGGLTLLNKRPTHGTDPCHVVMDHRGKYVLVSNFMSGSVCVLPVLEDGRLGEATDFIQHQGSGIDPVRQKGPHAHAVTMDKADRFAFVPDLGTDRVMVYRFDPKRGMLEPNETPWIKMKPGAGPRHLVFHPNGRIAFLINELDSTIAVLSFDGEKGVLKVLQVLSTLPETFKGASTCAGIAVSPSGSFVYGSNRGHDSIVGFRIHPATGRLTCVGHESTRGKTPRHFRIDPTGRFLLAANQDTDTIVTFRIQPKTGKLVLTGHVTEVPTPVCVKFFVRERGKSNLKIKCQ